MLTLAILFFVSQWVTTPDCVGWRRILTCLGEQRKSLSGQEVVTIHVTIAYRKLLNPLVYVKTLIAKFKRNFKSLSGQEVTNASLWCNTKMLNPLYYDKAVIVKFQRNFKFLSGYVVSNESLCCNTKNAESTYSLIKHWLWNLKEIQSNIRSRTKVNNASPHWE